MNIKEVMVAGGGVLGSQIAWQAATHGFKVTVFDPFEKGIEACKKSHKDYGLLFIDQKRLSQDAIDATFQRLSYTSDMEEAVSNADLMIEAVPEDLKIKTEFYQELAKVVPERTIFATNTSSMLPSMYAEATGRPEMFVGLHFATGGIWDTNIAEVMGHEKTSEEVYNTMIEYSRAMGMVPIPVKKENPGFVMNAMTIPWIVAGLDLVMNGVADHEVVDKAWAISTRASYGPCTFVDMAGMITGYNVLKGLAVAHNDPAFEKRAQWLKETFIDKGKLGMTTGEGFYKYPNPAWEKEGFLLK